MDKWKKYFSLTLRERLLFLQLLLLLPLTNLALKILGLKKLTEIASKFPTRRKQENSGPDAANKARRLAYLVSAASRHGLYHATCLRQSLLIWWLLRWQGIHSKLQIGVKKDDDQVFAHAWVEVNDEVINDGDEVEQVFSPFDSLSL